MTNTTTDTIPDLLRLDPSKPDEAVRLRIGIAIILGWWVRYTEGCWKLFGPSGAFEGFVQVHRMDTNNEIGAWNYFIEHEYVPDHFNSLDAAVTLPIDEGASWEITVLWNGHTIASIPIKISGEIAKAFPPYEESDQPAYAACRAWLA